MANYSAYNFAADDALFTLGDTDPTTFSARLIDFQTNGVVLADTGAQLSLKTWKETIGIIDGKLKFVTVPFTATLLKMQPLTTKDGVRVHMNKFMNSMQAENGLAGQKTEKTLQSLMITADRFWVWAATEKGLIDGMFLGLSICFPVAYVVLLGATKNILVATYAIFAIGCIVCCVLGFCESIMHWPLGIGETIAGIIVIGFSVDYVVHLGHMVEEADVRGFTTREAKFRYATETMGATVLAGAITTGGSALFMFACQMTFFYKMAVLICITIALSFVFSLGFFMAMVFVAGPEGKTGSLQPAFDAVAKMMTMPSSKSKQAK